MAPPRKRYDEPLMTREQHEQRAADICVRFERGSVPADIAKNHAISTTQVRDILRGRGYDPTSNPGLRAEALWEKDEHARRQDIIRNAAKGAREALKAMGATIERPKPADMPAVVPEPVSAPVVDDREIPISRWSSPREKALSLVRKIAKAHGMTCAQVTGMGRNYKLTEARHEAIFTVHVTFGWSYARVAKLFGGRDHTTILHSIRTYAARHPDEAKALIERVEAEELRDADMRNQVIDEIAVRFGRSVPEVQMMAAEV